jgi:hypothetical protein
VVPARLQGRPVKCPVCGWRSTGRRRRHTSQQPLGSVEAYQTLASTPSPTAQEQPAWGGRPGAGPPRRTGGPGQDGDKDRAYFATQAEAQAYLEASGGSPSNNVDNLDADHDGIAYEDLPGGGRHRR